MLYIDRMNLNGDYTKVKSTRKFSSRKNHKILVSGLEYGLEKIACSITKQGETSEDRNYSSEIPLYPALVDEQKIDSIIKQSIQECHHEFVGKHNDNERIPGSTLAMLFSYKRYGKLITKAVNVGNMVIWTTKHTDEVLDKICGLPQEIMEHIYTYLPDDGFTEQLHLTRVSAPAHTFNNREELTKVTSNPNTVRYFSSQPPGLIVWSGRHRDQFLPNITHVKSDIIYTTRSFGHTKRTNIGHLPEPEIETINSNHEIIISCSRGLDHLLTDNDQLNMSQANQKSATMTLDKSSSGQDVEQLALNIIQSAKHESEDKSVIVVDKQKLENQLGRNTALIIIIADGHLNYTAARYLEEHLVRRIQENLELFYAPEKIIEKIICADKNTLSRLYTIPEKLTSKYKSLFLRDTMREVLAQKKRNFGLQNMKRTDIQKISDQIHYLLILLSTHISKHDRPNSIKTRNEIVIICYTLNGIDMSKHVQHTPLSFFSKPTNTKETIDLIRENQTIDHAKSKVKHAAHG